MNQTLETYVFLHQNNLLLIKLNKKLRTD